MKLFSTNSNLVSIVSTIMVVIFLGASYFFIYLPGNEKEIQQQGFRTLQNIDNNIHAKVDNGVALLNNIIAAYQDERNDVTELNNYIQNYSRENFILKPAQLIQQLPDPDMDSITTIEADTANQFKLTISKKKNDKILQMSMKFGFEQFIKPLLPKEVFEQYIIFSKGKVVYQTFPSGLTYVKQDSLLGTKDGIGGSGIKNLTLGGNEYKMFLQPVGFNSHNEWIIAGLISNSSYQSEKFQLPPRIVLLLITLAMIIILIFPWLKLYQMGSRDRLTISDGVSSLIISMLLMSLLFFTFFKYNVPFRPDSSPDSKQILSQKIISAFKSEIDTAYKKLTQFDNLIDQRQELRTDIRNLDNRNISLGNLYFKEVKPIDSALRNEVNNKAKSINLSQVFWLNSSGYEIYNWTTNAFNVPHGNFRTRAYYKKIAEDKAYSFTKTPKQKYYLDQLISWTSGIFTTVIAKPSAVSTPGNPVIVALSFNMKSVLNTTLPSGYSYAIIDKEAKVLYHSDMSRNLNENLLEEFSEKNKLISSLEAQSKSEFVTSYFGKEYAINIQPVSDLPYFIAVFGDINFKETRDMEIYSFTISMLLILFGFLILELIVVFLVSARRSIFKRQLFDTTWVGPKESSHREYTVAAMANTAIILLLFLFFYQAGFIEYLLILLVTITGITILLNALFAKRYKNEAQDQLYNYKVKTITWLLVILVVINVIAYLKLDHPFGIFLLYEVLCAIVAGLFILFGDLLVEKTKAIISKGKFIQSWDFVHSFSLMALTRLIITSGIPVVLFYIASYNYEQNLVIRYKQFDFANRILEKDPSLTPAFIARINSKLNNSAIYKDSAWINQVGLTNQKPQIEYTEEDSLTVKLLNLFRFYKSNRAVSEDNFHLSHANDSSFFYNHLLKEASRNKSGTVTYKLTHIPGQYLQIASVDLNYQIPLFFKNKGALFWFSMIGALIAFYFLVLSIIKKLFAIDLPDLAAWKSIDDEILKDEKLNGLLFMIGLPGSGKLKGTFDKIDKGELFYDSTTPYIYNSKEAYRNNVLVVDMILIADSPDDKASAAWEKLIAKGLGKDHNYKLIIVNHFEYNIQDAATNRIKLNYLEQLMIENRSKVIILSTIHPTAFLDSFNEQQLNQKKNEAVLHDLERWHVLFGHYRIVINSLDKDDEDDSMNPVWERTIKREMQYTHFLNKMQPAALRVANLMNNDDEKIEKSDLLALKLQVGAHYFYMYIWQSLTKEEKFLLYDLAEDGLVNSFDDYNLTMLISKGVIIRHDGMLKLFNKGFRNFILTAIGNTEVAKIKTEIRDNGNWRRLRTPLLLIMIAILTFLFTSQNEAYSKLITYVSALAAGIPAVIKLLTIFEKTPQKNN